MLQLLRTTSKNDDFNELVKELNIELAEKNGDSNVFFAQFNRSEHLQYVVVAYEGVFPIGCGAIKVFNHTAMEIKRIYVKPDSRGNGIARAILRELELWSQELGFDLCVLETGDLMQEAIELYKKSGYRIIPNYGPYEEIANSICFAKEVNR